MESIAHFVQGALHVVAVFKQLDDPDAPLWMIGYGAVALLSFAASFKLKFFSEFWSAALTLTFVFLAWASQLFQQLEPSQRILSERYLETELGRESLGLSMAAIQLLLVARSLYNLKHPKPSSTSLSSLFFGVAHFFMTLVGISGILMAFKLAQHIGLYQPPVCSHPSPSAHTPTH